MYQLFGRSPNKGHVIKKKFEQPRTCDKKEIWTNKSFLYFQADDFKLGNCGIRWAYVLAIVAFFDSLILGKAKPFK